MRKLFYIVAFVVASQLFVNAQTFKTAADTEFFYGYGGTADDEARSIKELPGGGYIIAGTSASFGQGDASAYLIRTDSMGKHLWSASYGASQNDWAYSVEVTSDSGYFVAGYSNSFGLQQQTGYDAYYFKTDKNGIVQWQKTVAGDDWDFIYGTAPMADGGYILCGETYSNSNGGSDAYLIRINQNGDTLWSRHYGGLFDEKFNSVCVINNMIYAAGNNVTHAIDTVCDGWVVKVDLNGTKVNEAFFSGPHHYGEEFKGITPFDASSFFLCGMDRLVDSNSIQSIIAKMDTSLNFIVAPIKDGFTSNGEVTSYNQVLNISNSNICVVGNSTGGLGGENMFFVGYSSGIVFIFDYAHRSGGTGDDYAYGGIYTSSGRIIAAGSTEQQCMTPGMGLTDVFVARFNSDSILNAAIGTKNPLLVCFADTLPLWQASIRNYSNDTQISLFPNPISYSANLKISCQIEETYSVGIYSLLGNQLKTFTVRSNTENILDLSALPAGTYIFKVYSEKNNQVSALKFVKSD